MQDFDGVDDVCPRAFANLPTAGFCFTSGKGRVYFADFVKEGFADFLGNIVLFFLEAVCAGNAATTAP